MGLHGPTGSLALLPHGRKNTLLMDRQRGQPWEFSSSTGSQQDNVVSNKKDEEVRECQLQIAIILSSYITRAGLQRARKPRFPRGSLGPEGGFLGPPACGAGLDEMPL